VAPHREAFTAQVFGVLDSEDQEKFLTILQTLNDRLVEMGAPSTLEANVYSKNSDPQA